MAEHTESEEAKESFRRLAAVMEAQLAEAAVEAEAQQQLLCGARGVAEALEVQLAEQSGCVEERERASLSEAASAARLREALARADAEGQRADRLEGEVARLRVARLGEEGRLRPRMPMPPRLCARNGEKRALDGRCAERPLLGTPHKAVASRAAGRSSTCAPRLSAGHSAASPAPVAVPQLPIADVPRPGAASVRTRSASAVLWRRPSVVELRGVSQRVRAGAADDEGDYDLQSRAQDIVTGAQEAVLALEDAERAASDARAALARQEAAAEAVVRAAEVAASTDLGHGVRDINLRPRRNDGPTSIWGLAIQSRVEQEGLRMLRGANGQVFMSVDQGYAAVMEAKLQAGCLVKSAEMRAEAAERQLSEVRVDWERQLEAAAEVARSAKARASAQYAAFRERAEEAVAATGVVEELKALEDDDPILAPQGEHGAPVVRGLLPAAEHLRRGAEGVAVQGLNLPGGPPATKRPRFDDWGRPAADAPPTRPPRLHAATAPAAAAVAPVAERPWSCFAEAQARTGAGGPFPEEGQRALRRHHEVSKNWAEVEELARESRGLSAQLARRQATTTGSDPEELAAALRAAIRAWEKRKRQCIKILDGIREREVAEGNSVPISLLIARYDVTTDEAAGQTLPDDGVLLGLLHPFALQGP